MMDKRSTLLGPGSDPALKAMQIRHEISQFVDTTIADFDSVESGGGMGQEDIWFSVGGVRFHISIDWGKPPTTNGERG
jgi:hypothetical protein